MPSRSAICCSTVTVVISCWQLLNTLWCIFATPRQRVQSTKSLYLIGHGSILPWWQLDGCSVTRPFLSLQRVGFVRHIINGLSHVSSQCWWKTPVHVASSPSLDLHSPAPSPSTQTWSHTAPTCKWEGETRRRNGGGRGATLGDDRRAANLQIRSLPEVFSASFNTPVSTSFAAIFAACSLYCLLLVHVRVASSAHTVHAVDGHVAWGPVDWSQLNLRHSMSGNIFATPQTRQPELRETAQNITRCSIRSWTQRISPINA